MRLDAIAPRAYAARWLLAAICCVLPAFLSPVLSLPGPAHAWLYVIDVSESMNVADVEYGARPQSRLAAARRAVDASLRALPCGSRAALALFAGSEVTMLFEPLEVCAHYPAMEQVVARVSWRAAWIGDSRIHLGLTAAAEEARRRGLGMIFVTDGDEAPRLSAPRLNALLALRGKIAGWLIGVGGREPQPVPRLDADDNIVGYWQPEDAVREGFHPNQSAMGEGLESAGVDEHLSAHRPAYLRELASAAGLRYAALRTPAVAADAATDTRDARMAWAPRDVRWVCGVLASCCALLGWLGHARGGISRRRPRPTAPRLPSRSR